MPPNITKEPFRIFGLFYYPCIFIAIGLMIAIKKKQYIGNDFNHHGPKSLDSFWLNSVFAGIAISASVNLSYISR